MGQGDNLSRKGARPQHGQLLGQHFGDAKEGMGREETPGFQVAGADWRVSRASGTPFQVNPCIVAQRAFRLGALDPMADLVLATIEGAGRHLPRMPGLWRRGKSDWLIKGFKLGHHRVE